MKTRLIFALLLGLLLGQEAIAQTFTITNPVAGQNYKSQTVLRVQWASTYPNTTIVQLEFDLSLDGGATISYNAAYNSYPPLSGYYDLAIPNCSSANCVLFVTGYSAQGSFTDTSGTFTITPFASPSLGISMPSDTIICSQTNLQIIPQITGGQPPYQMTWTTSLLPPMYLAGSGDTLNFPDYNYYPSYEVTVAVTDANGLTGIDSMHVNTYAEAQFTKLPWGGDVPCGSSGFIGITYTGGTHIDSLQWYLSPNDTTVIGNDGILSVSAPTIPGTNTYVLMGTDQYGCYLNYDTVHVSAACNTPPVLAANDCYQLGTPDSTVGGYAYFSLHVSDNDVYDTANYYYFQTASVPVSAIIVNGYWSSPSIYNHPNYFVIAVPVANLGTPDSFQYLLYDYPSSNVSDTAWVHINTPCPVDSALVWPGDTYNDGLVDNTSLLPIGIGYGTSGIVRPNATINWIGQNCSNWADSVATGSNFKYIDCNGDGVINADDTMAIHNNFFLIHARGGAPSSNSGAPLSITPVQDTVFNTDTLHALIALGNAGTPAVNAYGIAFDINIDPLVVDTHFLAIQYINSWLGNTSELLTMSKYFAGQGLIKTAVTRFDHTCRTGYGIIATADFLITTSNINGKNLEYYQAMLSTASITLLDSAGNPIPVISSQNSTQVGFYPSTTSTQQLQQNNNIVKVYPNPARNQIIISANHAIIDNVKIIDMFGQQVASYPCGVYQLQVDVSALANGIYTAEIQSEGSTVTRRIVIAR